jgi:probable phosphoglycerate mutase
VAVTTSPEPPTAEYVQPQWALPAGATQLLLVRHGASAHAVAGRPFPLRDGHGDPSLSELGQAQAERVAERLRDVDVAALFVTTLVRTSQTAAPLARLLGLEPVVVPELREVLLGEWEGGLFRIKVHDGDPLAARMVEEERWDVIPGAESTEAFAKRVADGLRMVAEIAGPGATAVAFVHAGVIAEACRQASASRPFAFVAAENGSITRLIALPEGRLTLRSFNETGHLEADGPAGSS